MWKTLYNIGDEAGVGQFNVSLTSKEMLRLKENPAQANLEPNHTEQPIPKTLLAAFLLKSMFSQPDDATRNWLFSNF